MKKVPVVKISKGELINFAKEIKKLDFDIGDKIHISGCGGIEKKQLIFEIVNRNVVTVI